MSTVNVIFRNGQSLLADSAYTSAEWAERFQDAPADAFMLLTMPGGTAAIRIVEVVAVYDCVAPGR